ncbi:hypothetical protein D3C72_2098920 [compost metagenome]
MDNQPARQNVQFLHVHGGSALTKHLRGHIDRDSIGHVRRQQHDGLRKQLPTLGIDGVDQDEE